MIFYDISISSCIDPTSFQRLLLPIGSFKSLLLNDVFLLLKEFFSQFSFVRRVIFLTFSCNLLHTISLFMYEKRTSENETEISQLKKKILIYAALAIYYMAGNHQSITFHLHPFLRLFPSKIDLLRLW